MTCKEFIDSFNLLWGYYILHRYSELGTEDTKKYIALWTAMVKHSKECQACREEFKKRFETSRVIDLKRS